VRRRVGHLDTRPPGLTAVAGFGVAYVQAGGRRPAGVVARRSGGRVVRITARVVPDGADPPSGRDQEREELVPARALFKQSRAAPGATAVGGEHVLDLPLTGGLGGLEGHDERPVDVVSGQVGASQVEPWEGEPSRAVE